MNCSKDIKYFVVWFTSSFTLLLVASASMVEVESPCGVIQGVRKTDQDTGLSYVSFKGIPYAKPPLGDLRFAKPQPLPPITDAIINASKDDRIVCPHIDELTYNEKKFTEDCLVLNILTKDIDSTKKLKKVLVFIHGGGFFAWTGYFFEAKSFVNSEEVIVVTINYRLGVLGFLSTENDASPGNYGLWDQVLALKWVKKNIPAFGGDPDDITIAGESSGGAAVGYLSISPHTKGLFKKAYLQSGTASSTFSRSLDAQADTLSLAVATGCWYEAVDKEMVLNLEDSKKIVECLRKLPYTVFASHVTIQQSAESFLARVDNDLISDIPTNLLSDEDYLESIGFFDRTYLVGICNNEVDFVDMFFSSVVDAISKKNKDEINHQDKDLISEQVLSHIRDFYLNSRLEAVGESKEHVTKSISDFYKGRYDSFQTRIVHLVADLDYFIAPVDFLIAASKRQECHAFFFIFDYYPSYMKGPHKGIIHTADLPYWFDIEVKTMESIFGYEIDGEMNKDDLEMKRLFSSMIGEFMRSGEPELALKHILPSDWPKYDIHTSPHLHFNLQPWVGNFLNKEKQDLWLKTVPKLYEKKLTHWEL